MEDRIVADHWHNVTDWPTWCTHFSPSEMACRGTGKIDMPVFTLFKAQQLRDRMGVPLFITSAYRSPEHNRAVGGAKRSQHLLGRALDISVANVDPIELEDAARDCGFNSFGHYPKHGFLHVDAREGTPARWNKGGWFKKRDVTRFEPERCPQPAKDAAVTTAKVGSGAVVTGVAVTAIQNVEQIGAAAERIGPLLGWAAPVIATMVAGAVLAVAVVAIRQRLSS